MDGVSGMAGSAGDFRGNERFLIRRRLGAGATGAVYEAYDRERNEIVAVKTMLRVSPADIYHFKKEFRAVAGVAHPNLASLYELIADDNTWFFTMELIEGVTFLDYVRPPDGQGIEHDRLRSALCQLARGLIAVHDAGRLHRDVKPSNVLVTTAGRVVILDFGISSELAPSDIHAHTAEEGVWGTVAYMSPEQFLGEAVTPASDWYAVGTMLYEALTGRLPFTGHALQLASAKVTEDPVHPADRASDVPPDLAELCMALLSRQPDARPSGAELMRRIGGAERPGVVEPWARDGPLLGRHAQLMELDAAFETVRGGESVSVYVHGPSGIGKSRLVRQFADSVARRDGAVVLAGKCYVRESVPNKALDGVIDALSRYLRSLPHAEVADLVPDDVSALLRVFPILERVEAVADAPYAELAVTDARELRRRAVAALRALLTTIARRQPLVLCVDDLQWADAASADLLEDLLAAPDAPPLLLVASFRSEELRSQPFLQTAIARVDGHLHRELRLDRLSHADSLALIRRLLDPSVPGASDDMLEQIAWESGGVPFLIEQLTRYCRDQGGVGGVRGITVSEMLDTSIHHLPDGTRTLLDLLAVAVRPLDADVAYDAAGLAGTGGERALVTALSAAQLVRSSAVAEHVEVYHDRIRETLAARMDAPRTREMHRRLALALTRRGVDDPDALFEHYAGAGEPARAAVHAAHAAERAAKALAFDRAAFFFRQALELAPASASGANHARLTAGLAEALANGGRPADAARTFLAAADASGAVNALDYRRRAAEQFLMGGHTDEGLAVIGTLLRAVGLTLPTSTSRVLLSYLLRRAQLRFGGGRRTGKGPPTPDELLRIDVCWTGAAGLGLTEIIRAALFQTIQMLLALRAGEPRRLARALALDAGFAATPGEPARAHARERIERAREAATAVGDPYAIGLVTLTAGIAAYLVGEWRPAARSSDEAERILRDHATGSMWEVTSAQSYRLGALTYLGELTEVIRRVPVLLADAEERGNLYAATEVRTRQNIVWLVADEPETARREVTEALARWSHINYYRQHYNALRALMNIDLYVGDAGAAWERMEAQWPALRRSLMLRVQVLRIEAWAFWARAALRLASERPSASMLAAAQRLIGKIERERVAWAAPFVPLARAAIADMRGDQATAAALLGSAIAGFDRAEMALYAAAARRRLGDVTGGDAGRIVVREADAWMGGQRIKNPAAIAGMLAPGFVSGGR